MNVGSLPDIARPTIRVKKKTTTHPLLTITYQPSLFPSQICKRHVGVVDLPCHCDLVKAIRYIKMNEPSCATL